MAAVDQRVEGGQVEVAGLFTAGVPASIIECPSTAHRGYQAQWSENELDVAAHFVCPTEKRNLYFTGQVWAEVAASMAWFVGFAREGTILSASSALNVNDLVGFFSPAGSAIVQAVARREGVETITTLGTFSDGGVIELGLKVTGGRKGIAFYAGNERGSFGQFTMPEASTVLALTVAATQTASTARKFAWWGMLAAQDRKIES